MHTPRLKVWKLRETNVRQEFAQVAATQVEADKLSLHFNGDFEVDLCQPVFIEAKDDGGGGDNWSYKSCKYVGGQKDHRGIVRHGGGMIRQLKLLRRKKML